MINYMRTLILMTKTYVMNNKIETASIVTLLAVAFVSHAWNMFNFPYFENDESTYLARGWTFVTTGELDPYTYRYEHAPLGWIIIGIWLLLTGGTLFFSSFLVSGRIFMLIIHLISVIVLYKLGKNLFSRKVAILATLIFTLSPLAIHFQRRVLLDNIMTLFLLSSIYLLTSKKTTISRIILSSVFFAIAVLSKLNAAITGPVMLYIIWKKTQPNMRRHALMQWIIVAGFISLSFILLAAIKGELLPSPIGPDGLPERVSLIDSLKLQAGRGDFSPPWNPDSSFMSNISSWGAKDPLIVVYGSMSAIFTIVISIKAKTSYRIVAFLLLAQIAFIARGKIVLDLYITPIIPFISLATAAIAAYVSGMPHWKWAQQTVFASFALFLIVAPVTLIPQKQYTSQDTANQTKALNWITNNVPRSANIAIDNYAFTELRIQNGFQNADYMFMVEYDPQIRKIHLMDDWRNIDYILLTHEVVRQMANGSLPFLRDAFIHSELVAQFTDNTSSFISLDRNKLISTNGDWAQVYKVKDRRDIILQQNWEHFINTFKIDYGQIIDPSNGNLTTSGLQANAMHRAVEQNDQVIFDGVWKWSKDHLRFRSTDSLLSWKWELQADNTYTLGDSNTSTDADIQAAYALIKADNLWPNNGYGEDARQMIGDIWEQTVFSAGGRLYIDSSADGSIDTRLVNPSFFDPSAFTAFSTVNPENEWGKLSSDMYKLTEQLQESNNGLIPGWILVNPQGGISSAESIVGPDANNFNNQTIRHIVYLSKAWYNYHDPQALDSLGKFVAFFESEINQGRGLVSSYSKDGNRNNASIDLAMQSAAALSIATLGDREGISIDLVRNSILADYDYAKGYWGNETDLLSQTSGWWITDIDPEKILSGELESR